MSDELKVQKLSIYFQTAALVDQLEEHQRTIKREIEDLQRRIEDARKTLATEERRFFKKPILIEGLSNEIYDLECYLRNAHGALNATKAQTFKKKSRMERLQKALEIDYEFREWMETPPGTTPKTEKEN